ANERDAVTRRVFGDQSELQDNGHVVSRLSRQYVQLVQLPKIGITGAFDGMLHRSWPGIVSGHHQVPVAEHLVQVPQMARRGTRSFLRILALVYPPAMLQAVLLAAIGHELPESARSRAGELLRLKSALRLRQIHQVSGQPFLGQYALNHVAVTPGPS